MLLFQDKGFIYQFKTIRTADFFKL